MENYNEQHNEGATTEAIEQETAKLPSHIFLMAALGSMGVSLTLKMMGKSNASLFVGQWAAPFLLFGIYNKMVKQQGHDREDEQE